MTHYLTVVHECKAFNAWKAVFDADQPNRIAAGLKDLGVAQLTGNPNVVALIFEASDLNKAKAMVDSAHLRKTMEDAGVVGPPDIHFRQGELALMTQGHLLSFNCRISGIDKFKAAFAMDKADRVAAGISDLGLLQDIHDDNDLLLVGAMADVDKATRFLDSPALGEHIRQNTGIVGEPVRRFWQMHAAPLPAVGPA